MINRYTGSILGALGGGGLSAIGTLLIATNPSKKRIIKNALIGTLLGGTGGFLYGVSKEPFKVEDPGPQRVLETALDPMVRMSEEERNSMNKYTIKGISIAAPTLAAYGGYKGFKKGGVKGGLFGLLLGTLSGTALGTAFGTTVGTAVAPPSKTE